MAHICDFIMISYKRIVSYILRFLYFMWIQLRGPLVYRYFRSRRYENKSVNTERNINDSYAMRSQVMCSSVSTAPPLIVGTIVRNLNSQFFSTIMFLCWTWSTYFLLDLNVFIDLWRSKRFDFPFCIRYRLYMQNQLHRFHHLGIFILFLISINLLFPLILL